MQQLMWTESVRTFVVDLGVSGRVSPKDFEGRM